ncbi:dTDP-4-dehydrorhamnose 3,5-epimerase [Sediminispirochaeta smaragdinae]|uniref:dTDP-4-dehydrorhamnose 3,5-epimerase n=1 Tax=Sediminispirochaeta smaragdinae (strain DSM 11293 / JCM 15392 / SEBR 4228) TaxID=573413 RepID=E1RA01_SEDSS|nr:dTDP-4-dehydrorhamnose 3,5-epimerase [Sediminispirochaeta smaragdinae]ADK83320.1 dTDP-4-dehydrorhamnose 3,5-epimerase [Sediminispirochaeta smaragdinae DSM 11293]
MPFEFKRLAIEGLVVVKPHAFVDERGFFMETYKASAFQTAGIHEIFVQDNHSRSRKNVIRGLHLQKNPYSQGKLVRCVAGVVWDVAVDLRVGSPTYKQWYGLELSAENRLMFFLPPGFAHGFAVLSDTAESVYKVTAEYAPESDGGIRWNDPDIGIKWPISEDEVLISEKDRGLPWLSDLEEPYV